MNNVTNIADLIGDAYEAAAGRGSWEALMSATASVFRANAVLFNGRLQATMAPMLGDASTLGEPYLFHDGVRGSYRGPDVLLMNSLGDRNSAKAFLSMGSDPRMRDTSLYRDGHCGIVEHIVTMAAGPDNRNVSYACICRPSEQPPFSTYEIETFRILAVQLNRAWDLRSSLAVASPTLLAPGEPLDLLRHAVVLIHRAGELIRMNSSAKAILEEGVFSIDGIGPISLGDSAPWRRAIRHALLQEPMLIRRAQHVVGKERRATTAILTRAPEKWVPGDNQDVFALILGTGSDTQMGLPDWLLRAQYELTKYEIRFLRALMRSLNVSTAAKSIGVSKETGRSYLKSIFEKTDTHSQPELLSLILNHPLYLPENAAEDI